MNNKRINYLLMIVLVCFLSSCKKEISVQSDRLASGFSRLSKSAISPISIDAGKLNAPVMARGSGLVAGTYKDRDFLEPTSSQVAFIEAFKSDIFVVAPEMGLNVFPGAILDGHSIKGDLFAPTVMTTIGSAIRPINISTSLPVSPGKVAKTIMMRPSNDRAFVRAALKDLSTLYAGKIGAAKLKYEMISFSNYKMLKTLYGYNKNIDLFLYKQQNGNNNGEQTVTKSNGFMLRFYQENFNIKVDLPVSNDELFDPTGLDTATIFKGRSPYYVGGVTYGRMGIMTIESNDDSAAVHNAFTKQIGILQGLLGGGTTLTSEEKRIIRESEMRHAITGPSGTQLKSDLITLNSVEGFVEALKKGSTFSENDPGVPISFQLRYLTDDTAVESEFQIRYGPYPQPYARFEYEDIEYEHYSSQGIPMEIRKGKVYIKLYADNAATIPVGGYNFLKIKYKYEHRSRTLTADSENAYDDEEYVTEDFNSTQYLSKGSNYFLGFDSDISMSIRGPVFPSTSQRPRANMTGHTAYYINTYFVEDGLGYKKLPTKGVTW
ncbi:Pneumolysin [compost metagenome]